jgi:hypothetical protein
MQSESCLKLNVWLARKIEEQESGKFKWTLHKTMIIMSCGIKIDLKQKKLIYKWSIGLFILCLY